MGCRKCAKGLSADKRVEKSETRLYSKMSSAKKHLTNISLSFTRKNMINMEPK